ncbi:MAG: hypothetical protein ABFD81_16590 [Syntrophaceae bacterium]
MGQTTMKTEAACPQYAVQGRLSVAGVKTSGVLILLLLSMLMPACQAFGQGRLHNQLGDFEYQKTTNGILICAPHGTYDLRTDEIVIAAARELGAGYVVARGFTPGHVRINVNRPTEGAGLSSAREPRTRRSREVYDAYADLVRKAAGGHKLRLYVEVHGNSNPLSAYKIELATTGISRDEALRLKDAFADIIHGVRRQAPDYPRLALKVEPIDKLFFTTTGAKTIGIMADPLVPKALHFELPASARRPRMIDATAALVAAIAAEITGGAADFPKDDQRERITPRRSQ